MPALDAVRSGLRRAWRGLRGSDTELGGWLYRQDTVSWLYDAKLSKGLPLHLRAFGAYCGLQRRFGLSGEVVGGMLAFQALVELASRAGAQPYARLVMDGHVVHVNTLDARALHVPNELSRVGPNAVLLRRWLRPGDTFLDIGANHGTFSVLAAELVGPEGFVAAVEPQPDLARLIRLSLGEVRDLKFVVKELALGESAGELNLYVPRNTSGAAGVFPGFSGSRPHEVKRVEIGTLDDVLSWSSLPGRPFMKIDVEGSERAVLRGARRFLSEHKPVVLTELNDRALAAAGATREDLREEFQRAGYSRVALVPESGWLPLAQISTIAEGNILVVTEEHAASNALS